MANSRLFSSSDLWTTHDFTSVFVLGCSAAHYSIVTLRKLRSASPGVFVSWQNPGFFCAFGKIRFLKKLRCCFLQKYCFPEFSAHIKSYRDEILRKKSVKYHSKTTRKWCFRPYLTQLLVNLGKTQVHPR